jgi:hypothetical protein
LPRFIKRLSSEKLAGTGIEEGRFSDMDVREYPKEDDVLRRMLNTPHIPHKPSKESSPKERRKSKA